MVEAMDEYGVHTDPEDIVFNEEELDDSDVEEHHNIEVSEQQQEMQQVISEYTIINPFSFNFPKHVELNSSNIKGFPSYML